MLALGGAHPYFPITFHEPSDSAELAVVSPPVNAITCTELPLNNFLMLASFAFLDLSGNTTIEKKNSEKSES